jgi:maltooligosyltrehalose trehalohydrolase
MRRLLAGDADGYFADYMGTADNLARTLRQGWLYTGQHSAFFGHARGTATAGVPNRRFVICLQNHDQVGNRAFGDRLTRQIDLASWRASSAVLLLAPETPLLFMGQEWAATTPFLYFTDHNPALGRLVTEGRRREFGRFEAFADPSARERIPDPQADSTFLASRLDWDEAARDPHAGVLRLYIALIAVRGDWALGRASAPVCSAPDADTLVIRYRTARGDLAVAARLRGAGAMTFPTETASRATPLAPWTVALTTEDAAFSADGHAPLVDTSGPDVVLQFQGPAAVVLYRPAVPHPTTEES